MYFFFPASSRLLIALLEKIRFRFRYSTHLIHSVQPRATGRSESVPVEERLLPGAEKSRRTTGNCKKKASAKSAATEISNTLPIVKSSSYHQRQHSS